MNKKRTLKSWAKAHGLECDTYKHDFYEHVREIIIVDKKRLILIERDMQSGEYTWFNTRKPVTTTTQKELVDILEVHFFEWNY